MLINLCSASCAVANVPPPVQLGQVYQGELLSEYLLSEKFDGIRAIWRNRELRTRAGNKIYAPAWFTQDLPDVWLDGELWFKRNKFEYVASTVSKLEPLDHEWRNITYRVFDAPNLTEPFSTRAKYYTQLLQLLNIPHVIPIKQIALDEQSNLQALLKTYTSKGAEGVMLHKASALFYDGRSPHLLKVKPYMDSEAIVIAHITGSGKYAGLMGSILVEYTNNNNQVIRFKIGTGFSDSERANPPCIGCVVSFKYHGFTRNGIPRFASFIRIRQ